MDREWIGRMRGGKTREKRAWREDRGGIGGRGGREGNRGAWVGR